MGAKFKVVWVDRECSGVDMAGHLGKNVYNAKRCCNNCCIIFGESAFQNEVGPFGPGELISLNEEARAIQNELELQWPLIYNRKNRLIRFMKRIIQNIWILNFVENWIYRIFLCYRIEQDRRNTNFVLAVFNAFKHSWPLGKFTWVP